MNEIELRKLKRVELLELLLEQRRRCDRLEWELAQARKEIRDQQIKLENAGSLAEASAMMTSVLSEVQKATDIYRENLGVEKDESSRVLTRSRLRTQ